MRDGSRCSIVSSTRCGRRRDGSVRGDGHCCGRRRLSVWDMLGMDDRAGAGEMGRRAMTPWRPIETAPKDDDTEILVWARCCGHPDERPRPRFARYDLING